MPKIKADKTAKEAIPHNPKRLPCHITNTGENPIYLILTELPNRNADEWVRIYLPPGGTTSFDGSYKGSIWIESEVGSEANFIEG